MLRCYNPAMLQLYDVTALFLFFLWKKNYSLELKHRSIEGL